MKMKKLAILVLSLASLGVFCQILPAQEVDQPPVNEPDAPAVENPEPDNDGNRKPLPRKLKPGRPDDSVERPELPAELQAKIDTLRQNSEKIRELTKAAVQALENPTRDDIKAAMEQVKADNQELFDAQKTLGQEIKEAMKELRPDRPEKPELSDEAKALREQHKAIMVQMAENQKELREALANASEEERQALHDAFREKQKVLADQLKELRQQIREEAGNLGNPDGLRPERSRPLEKPSRTGDRRPTER